MPGSSPAQEIKEKLELVQFLRGYLNLQPAGKNFKANCPFHKEKTPSFMVSPERQTWHCFGCGIGGDIFSFLMRHDNLEFGEALRFLAEKAGVELRRLNPGEYEQLGVLYDINAAAKEFFKNELAKFEPAKKYLEERKLKKETVDEFEIGWAPNGFEALGIYLLKKGFRPEAILRAGLAVKNARGLQADRFRGRIMFPIENHTGKTVGFTGRVLPEFDNGEAGKYVNSPETPVFTKSRILYGLPKSREYIKERNEAILVEGQMDFLMCWQSGIKNLAATSGTALTLDHLRLLKRYAEQLIISFDSDEAGRNAEERALDLAAENDFNIKVASLDARRYKDPAEAAEKDPKALESAFKNAQPAMEFYFELHIPSGEFPNYGVIKKGVRSVLRKIKLVAGPAEQSFWIQRLHERVRINEQALRDEMDSLEEGRDGEPSFGSDAVKRERLARRELIARRLLSLIVSGEKWTVSENSSSYLPEDYRQVFELLKRGEKRSLDPRIDEIINSIYLEAGENYSEEELELLQRYAKEEFLKDKRNAIILKIKKAEQNGDGKALEEALSDFQLTFKEI